MVTLLPRYEHIPFYILWATSSVPVSAGTSGPFVVMCVVDAYRTGLILAVSAVAMGSFELWIKHGQWQNNHILSSVSEWNGNRYMRSSASVLVSTIFVLCWTKRRHHKTKGCHSCDIIGLISLVQFFLFCLNYVLAWLLPMKENRGMSALLASKKLLCSKTFQNGQSGSWVKDVMKLMKVVLSR